MNIKRKNVIVKELAEKIDKLIEETAKKEKSWYFGYEDNKSVEKWYDIEPQELRGELERYLEQRTRYETNKRALEQNWK